MSESTDAAPQAPAAHTSAQDTGAVVAPAQQNVAPAPQGSSDDVKMSSAQLKARLEEERQKGARKAEEALAKELGVSVADAKAALEKMRALEQERMSDLEKRDAAIKALEPKAQRAAELEAIVTAQANAAIADLDEAKRAAVTAIAGDDPARVLQTIAALRPTWATVAQTQAPTQAPPPAVALPRVPAPADTHNQGPTPSRVPGEIDHLAEYDRLRASPNGGKAVAAMYYARHASAIDKARQTR